MKKRRICMVTNWYPDEKNPYKGVFFKEQAFALSQHFDFLILHYTEVKKIPSLLYFILWIQKKHFIVTKTRNEENTLEYNITALFPMYVIIADMFHDFYMRYIVRSAKEGIGSYISNIYKKRKKRILSEIFKKSLHEEFDVLYCVDAQAESYTLKIISEITGKPYVVSEHAPFPWPGTSIKDIEHEAISEAALFFAISHDKIRQVMLQNIRLKRIAYVGNMVDETQFVLGNEKSDIKTFVIVAAHSFYKNYPLFIDVFERLTEITEVPFKIKVVGYGANKGYSKGEKQLEQLLLESKFSHNLILIPEISHDKIQEIYMNSDAFVMTSIQEGMPVSALEAACCGLPIFSTMCGGVEDFVNDKVGRIYKVMDTEAFAEGLKTYLEEELVFNPDYIREYVVNMFGKKVFVENIAKEFNEVIDASK